MRTDSRPTVPVTTVSVTTQVDPDEAEVLYAMYERAFGPLRTLAAARQVLTRDELMAELRDPEVTKYIPRDADGRALGLATVASDLSSVPWISPEFFAARYPDYAARAALLYVGIILVDPGVRGRGAADAMIDLITRRCGDEDAVALYDICGFNNSRLALHDRIEYRAGLAFPVTAELLDTQSYFGMFPTRTAP